MKKTNILLTALFLLIGMVSSHAQTTMEEFLAKWENSKAFTLEAIDKMPDDLLGDKPHESAMSFREQITHIGAATANISKGFLLGGEMDFDASAMPQSKAEMKDFITKAFDYGKKTIASLSEAHLSEKIDSFAGEITRRQMVGLLDDHTTHHRGAAIAYIRAQGIEPPGYRGI